MLGMKQMTQQMTRAQSNFSALFNYLILYYTVKLDLSCSSCNFTEKKQNNLASISRCMSPNAYLIKEGIAFLKHTHSAIRYNTDPVLQPKSR